MGGYIPTIERTTIFDGDTVRSTLRPMTQVQALTFQAMVSAGKQEHELVPYLTDVVRENLTRIEGVRDANGSAVDAETILRDGYFTRLVVELGRELIARAVPVNPTPPDDQRVG